MFFWKLSKILMTIFIHFISWFFPFIHSFTFGHDEFNEKKFLKFLLQFLSFFVLSINQPTNCPLLLLLIETISFHFTYTDMLVVFRSNLGIHNSSERTNDKTLKIIYFNVHCVFVCVNDKLAVNINSSSFIIIKLFNNNNRI